MVFILVATGFGLYLVWRLRGVIQLLAIALFLAFALFPVVDAVAVRTRAPRALVILAVYLILALLIVLIGYVVIPSLVRSFIRSRATRRTMRRSSAGTRRSGGSTTATTSPRTWCAMPSICRRSWPSWPAR